MKAQPSLIQQHSRNVPRKKTPAVEHEPSKAQYRAEKPTLIFCNKFYFVRF